MAGHPIQLGLIGYPLSHSYSPVLHTAALQALGLAGAYRTYPVPPLPEGGQELADLIARLRIGELQGLNVTIPHKQSVIPLVDELTPMASDIGAVNTIFQEHGKLMGDNTDAPGFLSALDQAFPELRPLLQPAARPAKPPRAIVLGAGGGARAVTYALIQAGWQVIIAAIPPQQAVELTESLNRTISASAFTAWEGNAASNGKPVLPVTNLPDMSAEALRSIHLPVNLIVNATPLGMLPDIESCPWPTEVSFPAAAVVFDLVYNPTETALLRAARQAGLAVAGGLGMLIEQAALSFERWTGRRDAAQPMRQAGIELLKDFSLPPNAVSSPKHKG